VLELEWNASRFSRHGKEPSGRYNHHRSSRNARRKFGIPRDASLDASTSNGGATARFKNWNYAVYTLFVSTALVVDGNLFSDR
jgi:hypothetical protein